jgi:hypothetical protein
MAGGALRRNREIERIPQRAAQRFALTIRAICPRLWSVARSWAMASLSSDDDDSEDRSHPLAQERPGVYVQVVSPRRKRERRSVPQEAAKPAVNPQPASRVTPVPEGRISAVGEVISSAQDGALGSVLESALDAQPRTSRPRFDPRVELDSNVDPHADPHAERPSGERQVVSEQPGPGYLRRSENSNGRSDLVVVTLPPPPRVPSYMPQALIPSQPETPAEYLGPSVLDAPTSMRARHGEAEVPARRVSWAVLGLVVALSAIVASALLVALRAPSADVALPQADGRAATSPFLVQDPPRPVRAEPEPSAAAASPPPIAAQQPPAVSVPPAVPGRTFAGAKPAAQVAVPAAKPERVAVPAAPPGVVDASPAARLAPAQAPVVAPASEEQPRELPENPYAEE